MRVIVITGASQGIGQAIAHRLAFKGMGQLCLLARNAKGLEAVAAQVRAHNAKACCFPCDVTLDEQVAEVAARIIRGVGVPDIVVNNAGHFAPGTVTGTTPEQFRQQVAVNLTSAFVVTQAFLAAMIGRGTGHILFMASVASVRAFSGAAAYCAAKHGLLGLARVVREETKPHGIRVTALLPGATMTPSWDGTGVRPERLMAADDVARAAVAACELSPRAVAEEIVLRPQLGDV